MVIRSSLILSKNHFNKIMINRDIVDLTWKTLLWRKLNGCVWWEVWNWTRGKRDFWFIKAFFLTLPFIEFSDANAKFYCRLYYAGEFHKMREVILGSSEEDFIRSLSHSSPWQARGGKSGAAFYATEGESFSRLLIQWYLSFPQVIHEWLELRQ